MRLISSASTLVMLSALAACATESGDVEQETSAIAEQGVRASADCDPSTLAGDALEACESARHREGKRLFDHETFDGNGRTCGTCHAKESGTLTPAEVARRAHKVEQTGKADPLFQHDALDEDGGIDRLAEHATIKVTLPLPWYVTLADDPTRREIDVFRGVPTTKNTPALDPELMHDRRAPDLEAQALGAIEDHAQNGREPTGLELELIAEFQKSDERFFSSDGLLAYAEGGAAPSLPPGVTESEQRGRLFFVDAPFQPPSKVGACALCHSGPMLNQLSNFGAAVFRAPPGTRHGTVHVAERNLVENPVYRFIVDDGLGRITEVETSDPGVLLQPQHLPPPFVLPRSFFTSFFKTPTLWGVKSTAPYFHNNAAKSLEEVVEQYDFFFANDPFVAGQIELNDQDRADIVAYLKLL